MKMIDIGKKSVVMREAIVGGEITAKPFVINLIKKNKIPKGNVLEAAKTAGILAVKNTPLLIPLCHPIAVEYVSIEFNIKKDRICIKTIVKGTAKTGVEMEALCGTTITALTIYDMCKMFDRNMVISNIILVRKTGGKSGTYERSRK